MAEKRFIKGLFKDTGHLDQPEGTWRHAKNMILNDKVGTISNEGGTKLAGNLTGGTLGGNSLTGNQDRKVIGSIEVNDNKVVLFSIDVVNSVATTGISARSEIGMWENNQYTTIFNPLLGLYPTNDLGFKESNPVEGTFKIDSKGDLVIYWTDDLNPPRAFNISRQLRSTGTSTTLYGINSADIQHIDILNLFPYAGTVPHIYAGDIFSVTPPYQEIVREGGGLLTAVYYLALAYVDDDLVSTNYLTVSNPVSIVDEYDHTSPTTKKDGAKEGSQTSKSITWRVNNLNTNYTYLRPVIVRKMGDATEAFRLNDLAIKLNSAPTPFIEVSFSGREGFTPAAVNEVIIDTISYDTAKTIEQLDNILYLGNTTKSSDLGYQKYANNIKSRSMSKKIESFDRIIASADGLQTGFGQSIVNATSTNPSGTYVDPSKSYRYIPNILNYRGYMRDEVYAFYIAFIMKDGSTSYAYHIPGRSHLTGLSYSGFDISGNATSELDAIPSTTNASKALKALSNDAKTFHFYDQSRINSGANSHAGGARHMQYWRNSTEKYPDTDNYEVWNGSAGHTGAANDLKDEPVRHHKMPSNANKDRTTVSNDLEVDITGSIVDPTPVVGGSYIGDFKVRIDESTGNYTPNPPKPNPVYGSTFLGESYTSACGITPPLKDIFSDNPFDPSITASVVYAGLDFTADADNILVTVYVHLNYMNDDSSWHRAYGRIRYIDIAGNTNYFNIGGIGVNGVNDVAGIQNILAHSRFHDACSGGGLTPCNGDNTGTMVGTVVVPMMMGEKLRYQSHGFVDSPSSCKDKRHVVLKHNKSQGFGWGGAVGNRTTNSYIQYTVTKGGSEDYHDADIKHNVSALGMHFDDIKIPASYKNKIQGFRIYRAKREYSNKTVLGQGPIIPIKPVVGVLGLCKQAANDLLTLDFASQVLGGEGREAEMFWACTSFKGDASDYSLAYSSDQYNSTDQAYKNLQFYDFNLLREKKSLAPATHIQVQYETNDLVWNGPELNQPQKMLTYLTAGAAGDPLKVKEIWGWDQYAASSTLGVQNCYTKQINSAMFVGAEYTRASKSGGWSSGTWGLNRVLGQKSKSYLQGDSIFNAASLGFGGKIVNLGGNSSIILGLQNKLELPAVYSLGHTTLGLDAWGIWRASLGFNLVTRNDSQIQGTGSAVPYDKPRHQNYIVNLNAFKTDVYKNIDNQELIFTGYEIYGENLDNFLFDDGSGVITSGSADFSTQNISVLGVDTPGVFGGDTFIGRYGVSEAYAPQDDQTDSTPSASIHSYIVESCDNIAFRHAESDDSLYYPGSIAKDVLSIAGRKSDLNHMDNIKYNNNYSAVNDIRPAFPLPVRDTLQNEFPTRAHRSSKNDTTSIIDNYRVFLANQFKDLPKNRGELWKLSTFNNLLYFHMEDSLFAAKGKQSMSMKDGSEAFVGSGDIFQQDPDEVVQTSDGYGGTQSQYAALSTKYGYFFINSKSKKIFLMQDKMQEISRSGINSWIEDHIHFEIDKYLSKGASAHSCLRDNPVLGFGFHSVYDPKHKRIILTKREKIPTQAFIDGYEEGLVSGPLPVYYIAFNESLCTYVEVTVDKTPPYDPIFTPIDFSDEDFFTEGGWTISYYPELNVWGSFHDYIPYLYFNTSNNFYSLTDIYPRPVWDSAVPPIAGAKGYYGTTFGNAGIWEHNSTTNHGILYQENNKNQYTDEEWKNRVNYYPFEFEFIHNELKGQTMLLGAFNYTLETFNQNQISILEHGFTSFFLYNTFQISGISNLEYLINIRRIGNNWKINNFRDMAAVVDQTGNTTTGLNTLNTSSYYMSTNPNVIGGVNVGTLTTSTINNMFIYNGMYKDVNPLYLDLTKSWDQKRKFIDKWVGIRLIYDNITNNFLNLYSTDVVVRRMHR